MATIAKPKSKAKRIKKPKGLIQRFVAYVKKNQEANRKAGIKPISEEFGEQGKSWINNLQDGMAKVGEEELKKMRGDKDKESKEYDDQMDFLIGRRKDTGMKRQDIDEEDPIDYILGRNRRK